VSGSVEKFSTYSEAKARAKEVARLGKQSVPVRKKAGSWEVLVPLAAAAAVHTRHVMAHFTDEVEETDAEREYRHEVLEPLLEEVAEEQDSWARSEEDGWYYED